MKPPLSILETCLYVEDLSAAKKFYEGVLKLELHSELPGRHLFYRCGRGMLLLFNANRTNDDSSALPKHGTRSNSHLAFEIKESEVEDWRRYLESKEVSIEKEHAWPNGGRSLYFRDPAGNSLEVTTPRTWAIDT